MLRRSPRAALLWCAALVVAVVTALWVGGTLASLRRQDIRYGAVVELVVARRDLPIGHAVTAGDLATLRGRGAARPRGALTATGAATGRVLVVPVLRGQPVTSRHLAEKGRDGRDGVVAPGWRAMRVAVTDTPRLRAGDHVDVYVTFDPGQVPADTDPTLTVADAVPVIGLDRAERTGGEATTGVTLMVDADEAPRLAFASANGILALALVPPEEARDPSASR